jgi:hypothetical protein
MTDKHAEQLAALKKQLAEFKATLESEDSAELAEWPASSNSRRARETLSNMLNDAQGIEFALQRLEGWLN